MKKRKISHDPLQCMRAGNCSDVYIVRKAKCYACKDEYDRSCPDFLPDPEGYKEQPDIKIDLP